MRKMLVGIAIFVLVLMSMVHANLIPYGIIGKVNFGNELVEGIAVKVETNPKDSGALSNIPFYVRSAEIRTNENGEFVTDLANSPFDGIYTPGFVLRVTVCEGKPECVQTKTIGTECDKTGGCDFIFDLTEGAIVTVGEEKVEVQEVIKYVCPDGSKVSDASLCPKDEWDTTDSLITGLIVLVIVGLGALFYYNRSKYKWAKGFGGILQKQLDKYNKYKKEGNKEKAKKTLETALKTSKTILEKYLKKKEEEEKEDDKT